jgi:hypothetical protein
MFVMRRSYIGLGKRGASASEAQIGSSGGTWGVVGGTGRLCVVLEL